MAKEREGLLTARFVVAGIGAAGVVASALLRMQTNASPQSPSSTPPPHWSAKTLTAMECGWPCWRRLFSVGDVPYLAGPGGAATAGDRRRRDAARQEARRQGDSGGVRLHGEVYELYKVGERLSLLEEAKPEELAALLVG